VARSPETAGRELERIAACGLAAGPSLDGGASLDGGSLSGAGARCWTELRPPTSAWPGWWTARDGAGERWNVRLASRDSPRPIERALAAARVAQALGLDRVTAVEGLLVPVATLGSLLAEQPNERDPLHQQLMIGNDGAVRALVERPCGGRPLDVGSHPLVGQWAKLAAQRAPLTETERRAIETYLQMVVLDFLTANLGRRSLYYDEPAAVGCLEDHRAAFPGYVVPKAMDLLLDRLRPIRHFPKGLARALDELDRAAAESLLRAGPFASWLVTPRDVTDLLERRATLRTLLYARQHAPR
jgi:hypothetical protein